MKISYHRQTSSSYTTETVEVRELTYGELTELKFESKVFVLDRGRYQLAEIHGHGYNTAKQIDHVAVAFGATVIYIREEDKKTDVFVETKRYTPSRITLDLTIFDREKMDKFLDIVGIDIDNVGDTFQYIYSKALSEYLNKNYSIK